MAAARDLSTSSPVGGRWAGSFSSIAATRSSIAAGTAGLIERTRGAGVWVCAYESAARSPSNGVRPVSISNSTQPREYRSARGSTRSPRTCSGEMYRAVPRTLRVAVRASGDRSRAIPMSASFTPPSGGSSTFDGLTSRWMTAFPWANARAEARRLAISPARSGASRPSVSSSSRSVGPSTSSITMNRSPPSTPASNTLITFGWWRRARIWASCWNRATERGSP